MDIVSSISHSIQIVKRLREISKNIEVAEFSNLLADLSNELADSKIEVVKLKQEKVKLEEKIQKLETKEDSKKLKKSIKWGCYQFEGEEGLYCTACFDTKGEKILTTRVRGGARECPVCKSEFR
ncbi:MAG: hypothetical protein WDZ80_03280 [Candidatus Paceibacterota bacterium]